MARVELDPYELSLVVDALLLQARMDKSLSTHPMTSRQLAALMWRRGKDIDGLVRRLTAADTSTAQMAHSA